MILLTSGTQSRTATRLTTSRSHSLVSHGSKQPFPGLLQPREDSVRKKVQIEKMTHGWPTMGTILDKKSKTSSYESNQRGNNNVCMSLSNKTGCSEERSRCKDDRFDTKITAKRY